MMGKKKEEEKRKSSYFGIFAEGATLRALIAVVLTYS